MIKTNLKAFGNIPPIKYQFSPREQLVPKLRQSETAAQVPSASSKRKAVTSIKNQVKKHQGYQSPEHAYEDVPVEVTEDQTEDVTTNVEDSENLANELAEAVKVSNNGD